MFILLPSSFAVQFKTNIGHRLSHLSCIQPSIILRSQTLSLSTQKKPLKVFQFIDFSPNSCYDPPFQMPLFSFKTRFFFSQTANIYLFKLMSKLYNHWYKVTSSSKTKYNLVSLVQLLIWPCEQIWHFSSYYVGKEERKTNFRMLTFKKCDQSRFEIAWPQGCTSH